MAIRLLPFAMLVIALCLLIPTGNTALAADSPSAGAAVSDPFVEFDRHAEEARQFLSGTASQHSFRRVEQFNTLREVLAQDRDRARSLAERGTLESRILKAQLEAIGPVPAEGKLEPPAVTQQREALNDRLGTVMKPVLRLREAEARAVVLIDEVDSRLSHLNHIHQFERGYSPVDPRLWMAAGADVAQGFKGAMERIRSPYRGIVPGWGLGIAVSVIFALFLIPWASRTLWHRLYRRFAKRLSRDTTLVRRMFLAMLGDAISGLVIGVSLVLSGMALGFLILPFLRTDQAVVLAGSVALAGFMVAIGQWMGQSLLYSPFPQLRLLRLPPDRARVALVTFRWIAYLLGGEVVINALEQQAVIGEALGHLISSVFVTLGAVLLWKLADLLREARRFHEAQRRQELGLDAEAPIPDSIDFITPISRLLKLFAISAAMAALVGYVVLSRDIFSSALLSLAIIAVAIYLDRSVALLIDELAKGSLHSYRRLLRFVPLFFGLLLTLLVVPLLAVIWGYSGHEIADMVATLRSGVQFGEVRLSAGDFITFIAVFLLGYFMTRWLQRFLKVAVLPDFEVERGVQAAIVTGLGYLGIFIAAIVAIATTGLDLSSLAFVAGALSVGLGFGLQSVVENFTSGILLLIERPVREGDWIEVGEYSGVVRKIAVRSTHIETADHYQIIIPNSKLISEAVKNRSFLRGATRITVPVNVAYGTDVDKVRAILLDIADKAPQAVRRPAPAVTLVALGDNALCFNLLVHVRDLVSGGNSASDINFEIVRRFAEEGIEIPFPQREVHVTGLESMGRGEPASPSQA